MKEYHLVKSKSLATIVMFCQNGQNLFFFSIVSEYSFSRFSTGHLYKFQFVANAGTTGSLRELKLFTLLSAVMIRSHGDVLISS